MRVSINNSRSIRSSVKNKRKLNSFVVKNKAKNLTIDKQIDEDSVFNSTEFNKMLSKKQGDFKNGRKYKATEEQKEATRKKYPGLKMLQDRDPEEAREIRRKGALAAHAARKRNLKLREVMETILGSNSTLTPEEQRMAIRFGIINKKQAKLSNSFMMMMVLFKKAMQGYLPAIEKIQDIIGENPWLDKVDKNQGESSVNINFFDDVKGAKKDE